MISGVFNIESFVELNAAVQTIHWQVDIMPANKHNTRPAIAKPLPALAEFLPVPLIPITAKTKPITATIIAAIPIAGIKDRQIPTTPKTNPAIAKPEVDFLS